MKRTAFFTVMVIPLAAVAVFLLVIQDDTTRPQHDTAMQSTTYRLIPVVEGLSRPIYLTHAGDGSGRLFVVEQSGTIRIIDDGAVLETPFLDVSTLISPEALSRSYTERGLLGLAFHPDYAENGVFFIDYTDQVGNSVIARYSVSPDNPNRADPNSAEQLLYVSQPYRNHNGGQLAFGPDGYLYVSLGDGGSAGDPQGNGQNLNTLLGSILRIDVDTESGYAIPADNPFVGRDDARPEIWAWGLRNVWRFSFDRETGDMYLADVGQNQWEEVNFQSANSAGGENYGWNAFEASHVYSGAQPASDVVEPVLAYNHSSGWCSITGGYVYRGSAVPGLQDYYLYGDWCTGTIWAGYQDAFGNWHTDISLESGRYISSFGEDETGEMYVVDHNGAVLRIAP